MSVIRLSALPSERAALLLRILSGKPPIPPKLPDTYRLSLLLVELFEATDGGLGALPLTPTLLPVVEGALLKSVLALEVIVKGTRATLDRVGR